MASQRVLVTGGAGGIGLAITRTFVATGARVHIADPDAEALATVVASDASGAAISGSVCDIADPAAVTAMFEDLAGQLGGLDVLVNNAGIETRTSILDTTEADYQRVLDVNLKSAFFGTQFAAKQFIAQGDGGLVLNISSVHEDWPMPGNVAYCVSKGGTRMLTRTAGVELGPHGIRVVNIAPGAVATPINSSTMADPEKLAALNGAIPLGRIARPEEIADVVVFLASGKAAYMTATTVFIDGGIMQGSVGL